MVAHLVGLVDDFLAGRLDGAGSPPWTAVQVERRRDVPVDVLVRTWTDRAGAFEELPPPVPPVIDIVTHEQDLRGALGRAGARDAEELAWAFDLAAQRAVREVPDVRIEVRGAAYGPADAPVVLTGDRFELFRVFLGRRSARQLQQLDWRGGMPADAGRIMLFGPAVVDIVE